MRLQDWYRTYREHSAWSAIESTLETTGAYEANDDQERDMLDYIRLVLTAVLEWRNAPTILISESMLQGLQAAVIKNVQTPLVTWGQTSNLAHLSQAHSNLHTVLEAVRGWPKSKEDNLRSAAAVLREAIRVTNGHIGDTTEQIEQAKADLGNQLQRAHERFDEREDSSIDKFREIEAKVRQVNEAMSELDERLDTLTEKQQERFDNSQQERLSDFNGLLKEHRNALDAELDRQRAEGNSILEEMEGIKSKTAAVSSVVATSTTSEAYKIEADQQKRIADSLRDWAVRILSIAAVVTVIWIYLLETEDSTNQGFLIRIGLSLTLVGAAVYLVRESTRHRNKEFSNRDLELKLRALDPFIQPVEPGKREELMLKAAHYFFGLDGEPSVVEAAPQKETNSLYERFNRDEGA